MQTIQYPLKSNGYGDLSIVSQPIDVAVTRANILLDIKEGERKFLPEFGVSLPVFLPDTISQEIEADLLTQKLRAWCIEPYDQFNYDLLTLKDDSDRLRIQVQVKLI